jgi:guanylate kinase
MSSVFIVSAPSGSGKSTLVRAVLARDRELLFSVSYTTRQPRGVEQPGQDYHFISRESFEQRIRNGEFVEWADVFGNYYGTHRSVLDRGVAENKDVLLDIDVQGARQLKESIPDAISIFVLAPSREVLEERLRKRSEDSEAVIEKRLKRAVEEIRNYERYDYIIVNDELERSTEALVSIIKAERVRRVRAEPVVRSILATFE